jgi:hypothetical protein
VANAPRHSAGIDAIERPDRRYSLLSVRRIEPSAMAIDTV